MSYLGWFCHKTIASELGGFADGAVVGAHGDADFEALGHLAVRAGEGVHDRPSIATTSLGMSAM